MQGTVKISEEFVTPTGLKKWIGIDFPYESTTHEPIERGVEAARIVREIAKKLGLILEINHEYANLLNPDEQLSTIQVEEQERQIGTKPEDILSSPDLVVLESYRWIIKGKPELERAYTLRHDQLTQKQ